MCNVSDKICNKNGRRFYCFVPPFVPVWGCGSEGRQGAGGARAATGRRSLRSCAYKMGDSEDEFRLRVPPGRRPVAVRGEGDGRRPRGTGTAAAPAAGPPPFPPGRGLKRGGAPSAARPAGRKRRRAAGREPSEAPGRSRSEVGPGGKRPKAGESGGGGGRGGAAATAAKALIAACSPPRDEGPREAASAAAPRAGGGPPRTRGPSGPAALGGPSCAPHSPAARQPLERGPGGEPGRLAVGAELVVGRPGRHPLGGRSGAWLRGSGGIFSGEGCGTLPFHPGQLSRRTFAAFLSPERPRTVPRPRSSPHGPD